LSEFVIFAGVRADIPRLMVGAIDVLVFPSRYEGLALVLIEAQAAGLPCVCSDVISGETEVVETLIQRLSLRESPDAWADAIVSHKGRPRIPGAEARRRIERSPFNISESVRQLEHFYNGCRPH
jgi:glycosyltransferase involved in cell wall biosynthesis